MCDENNQGKIGHGSGHDGEKEENLEIQTHGDEDVHPLEKGENDHPGDHPEGVDQNHAQAFEKGPAFARPANRLDQTVFLFRYFSCVLDGYQAQSQGDQGGHSQKAGLKTRRGRKGGHAEKSQQCPDGIPQRGAGSHEEGVRVALV